MSDAAFFATLRETIAHLASHDPQRQRFGARQHGYQLEPPLAPARLAAIEEALGLRLPDEQRGHLLALGDGGVGPYHGLMPIDHPVQLAAAAGEFAWSDRLPPAEIPVGPALYQGVLGLAHLGCGYIAFLVVRGPARGQVWLDARGSGDGVWPIYADFRRFWLAWVQAVALQRWPDGFVTPGRCALPSALTAYLHTVEARLGVPAGGLSPAALRDALSEIPDGGIAAASDGDTPFFAAGDLVDLCPVCEHTVDNLAPSGLRRAQLRPGVAAIPMRDRHAGATAPVTPCA